MKAVLALEAIDGCVDAIKAGSLLLLDEERPAWDLGSGRAFYRPDYVGPIGAKLWGRGSTTTEHRGCVGPELRTHRSSHTCPSLSNSASATFR